MLERVKFLAIASRNLDHFFQVRVAGLKTQIAAEVGARSIDGRTPAEQLAAIRPLVTRAGRAAGRGAAQGSAARACATSGSISCSWDELEPARRSASSRSMFETRIFPVLTPLSVDPSHPVPVHLEPLAQPRGRRARSRHAGAPLRAHQGAAAVRALDRAAGRRGLRSGRAADRRARRAAVPGDGDRVVQSVPRDARRRPRARRDDAEDLLAGGGVRAQAPPAHERRGAPRGAERMSERVRSLLLARARARARRPLRGARRCSTSARSGSSTRSTGPTRSCPRTSR